MFMKLDWGNVLKFADEREYYEVLGFLAKDEEYITWTYIQRIDRYRNVCHSCYFFWWDTSNRKYCSGFA